MPIIDVMKCPECGKMVSVMEKLEQPRRFYVLRKHRRKPGTLRQCPGSGMEVRYGR